MSKRLHARSIPSRLVTGLYVAHTGLEKWRGNEERAATLHDMAAGAFPTLKEMPAAKFMRLLASVEIATGAVLLAPMVRNRVAGAALTAFGAGLVTMYLRTPSLHQPDSYWPTQAGTAVSKDIWLVGIGLRLLLD